MKATEQLERLRGIDIASRIGTELSDTQRAAVAELESSGTRFASSAQALEDRYYRALGKLLHCIATMPDGGPILYEGGVYHGCWLESTGTINAELLSRFMPSVAQRSFERFAEYQRDDGQLPYKVGAFGAAYRQIQMVTPLARSVWNHYRLQRGTTATAGGGGLDRDSEAFLPRMYEAMARFDAWLAKYRNTRGSGCVEAFCTFDTGHDLSSRFWHVPDTCYREDARRFDPQSPLLPYLAPDLTANVYCQRHYLGRIAEELDGQVEVEMPEVPWAERASESLQSLMTHCFDGEDGFFYDRDRHGRFVRVQSDVLLRVLACEVGDGELFSAALERYLLNMRKFYAAYPLTSVAMDDPRFDPFSSYNSWAGPTNFLTLIRTPHAFEYHGHVVELGWIMRSTLSALSRMERFGQCISPWTGEEGFTESYSPALLCMLDFVERYSGILPRPDGEVWFSGMLPVDEEPNEGAQPWSAYRRIVDGTEFVLLVDDENASVLRDGEAWSRFPSGVRLICDRRGEPKALVGLSTQSVSGELLVGGRRIAFELAGNQRVELDGGRAGHASGPAIVYPAFE